MELRNIKIMPNLFGELSLDSKEKPYCLIIGSTAIAMTYSELMELGVKLWDLKEETKVNAWK